MKRSTTEILRRGFDSMLANWPLIAIRIAENLVFLALIIGSVLAAIVPVAVAAGLSSFSPPAGDPAQAAVTMLVEHWPLIFYVLAIATIVLVVLIVIHSFIDAGSARVFVEAERSASRSNAPGRAAFGAFNMERWLQGGRASWWSVFWIYNIAWGVGGLVMLVPLLATLAGMLAVSEAGARVVIGCAGILVFFLIALPTGIVIAIWTQKAIAVTVARTLTAGDALRLGWGEVRKDFGRHFAVAFIVFVIMFGGTMAISMLTTPFSLVRTQQPLASIFFAPAQVAISFAQTIFSAAVGLWFLASYVGLTEER